jgi:hypothetical protein
MFPFEASLLPQVHWRVYTRLMAYVHASRSRRYALHVRIWYLNDDSCFQQCLKSTAVPKTINQASIHRTRRSSSDHSTRSTSFITSPTDADVSHGWKYQQGVPNVGWSPCESNGNEDVGRLTANDVVSVPSRVNRRNREVFRTSAKHRGDPSAFNPQHV